MLKDKGSQKNMRFLVENSQTTPNKRRNGLNKFNVHFHTFRHTFATMLFEKKINPKIIQLLLGHKSVKTTLEIYNNVSIYNKEMLEIINNVFK